MATEQQVQQIYTYIVGLYKAAPGGYLSALEGVVDGGMSAQDMALALAASPSFTGLTSAYSANAPDEAFVSTFLTNLLGNSVSAANFDIAETALLDMLDAGMSRAEVAVLAIDLIAAVPEDDADWGGARQLLDGRVDTAMAYNNDPFNWIDTNLDGIVDSPTTNLATLQNAIEQAGTVFNLEAILADSPTGADRMRLTGDQDVRIDFTNPDNQVTGLDYDADGVIENDGVENTVSGVASDFEIVDAYARDAYNENDAMANFLGDIDYDGTGFDGDGVDTDGNIFLGGLGADVARAGIGNDFLTGGGVADKNNDGVANDGVDMLYGGRNADFFFASLSDLATTDGDTLRIDGGQTTDDSAVVGDTAMDSDWLLLEVADDEDGTVINMLADGTSTGNGVGQTVTSGNSASVFTMNEIENVDASGNLYGFLDDIDVALGENGTMVDGENVAIGATSQLWIQGSDQANIFIGGYDNDRIEGNSGDDLLFGGNLNYNNNPNTQGIINDGVDELIGGDGADNVVFEADGGVYEGGAIQDFDDVTDDTLWLFENTLGESDVDEVTDDGVLRFDLAVGKQGGINNYAGYGGADQGGTAADFTADQTNYSDDFDFALVQDFESVIATGLGGIDYLAAGTNDPELNFDNQQNFAGYEGDLHLRGTDAVANADLAEDSDAVIAVRDGDNILYANTGDDVLEGRTGDDLLSGGAGNDDFIFALDGDAGTDLLGNVGDGLDVIHRQADVDGDGLWDTDADDEVVYTQDFGVDSEVNTGASSLILTVFEQDAANNPINDLKNITVNQITTVVHDPVNGDITVTISAANSDIADADTHQELLDAINLGIASLGIAELLDADGNSLLSADLLADNTIIISHALGYELEDQEANGALFSVSANNIDAEFGMEYGEPPVATASDRLIFAAYEDRADGELVDDDGFVNQTGDAVTLGADAYAEDLVVRFDSDGNLTTVLAEDQQWDMLFANLADEDTLTISVNGTAYSLQMGVAADGTAIGETQAQFLQRMVDLINAGSDNDTLAGTLVAALAGNTISLTQGNYYGGQVAFMDEPVVTLGNASGGEPASVTISQPNTDSEVTLFEFDGRDNALNEDSVLFLGGSGMNDGVVTNADNSRSILATAADAGGDLMGSDALVVDSMTDVNTLATDFSLHGDDLLFTGIGDDDVDAGTGDDRIFGSVGTDTVDGGKDLWVVQTLVNGAVVESVVEGNDYDAAQLLAQADVVAVNLLEEDNAAGATDGFVDHLIFSQADFAGTRFTITIDDDLEQQNGGAGTVGVDENDDGTIDHTTTFTEMEAIRTLAGDGTHAGQGNDTLDVAALSDAVAASDAADPDAGVVYNMTSDLGFVAINADLDGDDDIEDDNVGFGDTTGDEIDDFIAVDGVERLIGGNANDTLNIDEAEVNKDNYFDGDDEITQEATADDGDPTTDESQDMVGDRIYYNHRDMNNDGNLDDEDADGVVEVDTDANNDGDVIDPGDTDLDGDGNFDTDEAQSVAMRPSLEIVVESGSETDLVNMTGGTIIGSDTTVDTLVDVETVDVTDAAISLTLDDTVNVSSIAGGYVDYAEANIGTSNDADDELMLLTGMTEMENVEGSTSADTVVVANAMTNTRAQDSNDATTAISYATFLDYDDVDANNDRIPFTSITAANRAEANNQALFTFDLGDGQDRVDYAEETGGIAVVVDLEDGDVAQTVMVDEDGNATFDEIGTEANDRIDLLQNVEEVVASQGQSILDFTGADTNLSISYMGAADSTASTVYADTREHTIAIEDLDSSVPFSDLTYIELMDDADGDLVVGTTALWNRIEGSDYDEKIELTDDQSAQAHIFNLRGGDNELNYNELTRGIIFSIDSIAGGVTTATITALETDGVTQLASDTLSAYNTNSLIDPTATLRVEASQSEDDVIDMSGLVDNNLILLGTKEGLADIIEVTFDTTGANVGVTLSGFESLRDSQGDDVYEIEDLSDFFDTLFLVDNAAVDSDTLKLNDDALEADFGVTWNDDSIELDDFEDSVDGANDGTEGFDFDTLDISALTEQTDTVNTNDADETLILGDLDNFGDQADAFVDVRGFAKIQFTTSDGMGTDVVIDMDLGEFREDDGTILFTFDSASVFDFSAVTEDMTVTVVDTAGAGVTVITDAEDAITGDAGNDFLVGGVGADTLDGGVIPTVGPVISYTLNGGAAILAADADSVNILGINVEADTTPATPALDPIGTAYAQVAVAVGADSDAVGGAFASVSLTDWKAALTADGGGLNTLTAAEIAELESVTYNATDNRLIFTFADTAATAGIAQADFSAANVADIGAGGMTVTLGNALDNAYTAEQNSADIYAYYAASESTAAAMDTIENFDASDLIWLDSSIVTAATVTDLGDALDFTDLGDGVNFFATTIAVGTDGTDGRIFIDVDADGDLTAADMQIKVDGATNADDFDAAGDYVVGTLGTPFADALAGVDGDTDGDGVTDVGEAAVADTIYSFAGNDQIDITENAVLDAADTIVFAATAAANGTDNIVGFEIQDTLNFDALLTNAAAFNAGFSAASVGNVNVDNDVNEFDNAGTALTAATLAAEFAGGGTAFSAAADDVAVILEIDSTAVAEDANLWYVADANSDGVIAASEVALVGVVSDAGDLAFAIGNF